MTAELMPSLRDEYKERTRMRLVGAAVALMREGDEESITMASVAARAGVGERTVYRHFATRDALVEAVWKWLRQWLGSEGLPETADDLIALPAWLFPRLDDENELVRAYLNSRAWRRARERSNRRRQRTIVKCVRRGLPQLDEHRLRRRAAIVQLITSPEGWDLMRRLNGFDGIEAGDAAAEALMILLDRDLAN